MPEKLYYTSALKGKPSSAVHHEGMRAPVKSFCFAIFVFSSSRPIVCMRRNTFNPTFSTLDKKHSTIQLSKRAFGPGALFGESHLREILIEEKETS